MSEIEHQGTVAMAATNPISRELLRKIVDEVFDGAIEDASVIEEIYAAIKKHETPPPQAHAQGPGDSHEPVEIPGELEMFEGKLTKVVDTSRTGWWRYHQHRDRDGYCDNPARGY